ncbi:mechanosensitive ion channel family protein [Pseudothermotoga elfii]
MSKELLIKILESIITIVVSYLVYRLLYKSIAKTFEVAGKELRIKNTVRVFLATFTVVISLMVILNIWKINLVPYLTAFGITGFVVGLAFQEPLSNFISGILVLLTGKLREGDVVDVDGTSGVVEVINYNHTILRMFDGKKILIPNKQVWNGKITHFWPGPVRRLSMKISVSYDSDLSKVLELLQKCVEEEPLVEKEGVSNFVVFSGFADSSIDFEVLYWIKRENYFEAQHALAQRIKRTFDENGISIPFPQMDVHIEGRN